MPSGENLEGKRGYWGKDRRMMPKGHGAKKTPMYETIAELETLLEIIRGLITSFPR